MQLLMVCCIIFSGMTLTHRVLRSQSSNASREVTISSLNGPADSNAEDQQTGTGIGYLRGCADLPPTIPNEQDRPLIEPEGNS